MKWLFYLEKNGGGVIIRQLQNDEIEIEPPDLPDYKFFCFDSHVKMLYVATERHIKGEDAKFDFFDAEFNHLPVQQQGHPNASKLPNKPSNLERMKELASQLSKGIPHVRVDFYDCGEKIYFGEMTFYSMSGFAPYTPEEWDAKFGEWVKLPSAIN